MRKKTIAWLFIIGIVLSAIGGGVSGAATAAVASGGSPNVALALVGTVFAVVGGIVAFISWIGALMATGKQSRWGWFVVVLLLLGLGELIYLIAGPGLNKQG